jgi:hypothetical protein
MNNAAVGTDGTRPVVWGVGKTGNDARADAESQLVECDGESPLVTVEISDEQLSRIKAGVVDAPELGIRLTPGQLRDLRGETVS